MQNQDLPFRSIIGTGSGEYFVDLANAQAEKDEYFSEIIIVSPHNAKYLKKELAIKSVTSHFFRKGQEITLFYFGNSIQFLKMKCLTSFTHILTKQQRYIPGSTNS